MKLEYGKNWGLRNADGTKIVYPTMCVNNYTKNERKINFFCSSGEVYEELLKLFNSNSKDGYTYFPVK